jgi:hypothetical protein
MRQTTAALLLLASPLLLAGCGSGRSVEAFCQTYHDEKARITDVYRGTGDIPDGAAPTEGPGAIFSGWLSVPDQSVMYSRLGDVAPDEIATVVGNVRVAVQNGGKPGAVIVPQGNWDSLGAYVARNCGDT